MKIFCTGITGFIGSYLAKELLSKGHQILALKRETSSLSRLENHADQINWVNTASNWEKTVEDFAPEAIFNIAWNGVSAKDRSDWGSQVSNIAMQQELLDLTLRCKTSKFIGIGSQSEYGDFEQEINESYPEQPKTAYAASKTASMVLMRTFCEINHIDWYWFRVFPVFGPFEGSNWLIPSLIKNICTSDHMDLTPGDQRLPYLYVGECAKAIANAVEVKGECGIYNVCGDNPIPLKELVSYIRDKINPKFTLNFGAQPYRYGQSMYMGSSTEKLANHIYKLKTDDFEERLNETINFYLNKYGYEK